MSSVTPCSVCGGPLEGKYANALTCSSRCRQKLYRLRAKDELARRCNAGVDPVTESEQGPSWTALREQEGLTDREMRRALIVLQVDADPAARERIGRLSITEADRRLFASEAVS